MWVMYFHVAHVLRILISMLKFKSATSLQVLDLGRGPAPRGLQKRCGWYVSFKFNDFNIASFKKKHT